MMHKFPDDFFWGISTSSFQVEGAWNEDEKGESIWDRYCLMPGNVRGGDTSAVACDYYHRFRDDLKIVADMGVDVYRFSISWPRVLPSGTGEINRKGVDFYRAVIDTLQKNNIKPMIILYMWDLPQALQDRGGWLNPAISDWFADYADAMFREFGEDVVKWITVNEPHVVSHVGHAIGRHAPGIRDFQASLDVAHNLLLAHGKAVRRYRDMKLNGEIGIGLNLNTGLAASNTADDRQAAERINDAEGSWFFSPVFRGGYPPSAVKWFEDHGLRVNEDADDFETMRAPVDFVALNYYKVRYIANDPTRWPLEARELEIRGPGQFDDAGVNQKYPEGMYDYIMWAHNKWKVPKILVGENGCPVADFIAVDGAVHDHARIDYLYRHIEQVHRAIADGAPVEGYLLWSLLDNFELSFGYSHRFGAVYVDFETQKRVRKDSSHWYSRVTRNNALPAYEVFAATDRGSKERNQ